MYRFMEEKYGALWNQNPPPESSAILRSEIIQVPDPAPDNQTQIATCRYKVPAHEVTIFQKLSLKAYARIANPWWVGTMPQELPDAFFLGRITWLPLLNNAPTDGMLVEQRFRDGGIYSHGGGNPIETGWLNLLKTYDFSEGGPTIMCPPGSTFSIRINFGPTTTGHEPPPADANLFLLSEIWGYKLDANADMGRHGE